MLSGYRNEYRPDDAKDIEKIPFNHFGLKKGIIGERIGKKELFSF